MELDETAALADADPARTKTLAGTSRTVSSEIPAGMRLGHFRIDKQLGAGGMGEVYLATDLALDRPVAIKVLPSGVVSGAARERLIREARAQARVQHPNVAHIYFIGEDAGRLYFAMEYVAGQTLAERTAAGPLPVEDALGMVRGAVLGLREAQRSGFTHRDVKPSNLMVDAHGIVKVLDFGLASSIPEDVGDGPVEQTSLAGTPLYMAPEQARGEAIDLRADIYALGATLYHLVSGKPPFQADTIAELASMHATAVRPPLPRGANPRAAISAIDSLIARMMAPRPDDRFASYDELLRALDLVSVEHTKPAGFLVRTVATGIDWIFAAFVTSLVKLPFSAGVDVVIDCIAPVAAVVLAALTIARYGTTPGKAMFELEIVAIDTARRPTWSRALLRELALVGVPLALSLAQQLQPLIHLSRQRADDATSTPVLAFGSLTAVSIFILLLELLHSSLRVPGKRAIWDRASKTQVRYRVARRETAALLP